MVEKFIDFVLTLHCRQAQHYKYLEYKQCWTDIQNDCGSGGHRFDSPQGWSGQLSSLHTGLFSILYLVYTLNKNNT